MEIDILINFVVLYVQFTIDRPLSNYYLNLFVSSANFSWRALKCSFSFPLKPTPPFLADLKNEVKTRCWPSSRLLWFSSTFLSYKIETKVHIGEINPSLRDLRHSACLEMHAATIWTKNVAACLSKTTEWPRMKNEAHFDYPHKNCKFCKTYKNWENFTCSISYKLDMLLNSRAPSIKITNTNLAKPANLVNLL